MHRNDSEKDTAASWARLVEGAAEEGMVEDMAVSWAPSWPRNGQVTGMLCAMLSRPTT